MIFISPPFGNYFNLPKTIPIRGSFTLNERPGKWSQIFKTLRYVPYLGWVNKIGLRNPGIDYAINTYKKGEIISIAIMDKSEIKPILDKIPEDMDIELNVSCPNTEESMVKEGLKPFLNNKRNWCIIKLSPTETCYNINCFYEMGFRQFHASNTLPSKRGGVSGEILKPYTMSTIRYLKNNFPDAVVIAGGGIYDFETLKDYEKKGADHFSISTIFFNPFKTVLFFSNIYF
tara:strand:- start:1495 stop:2187 length:693 start_codon:yes stop_codon:yes gene_type:complete